MTEVCFLDDYGQSTMGSIRLRHITISPYTVHFHDYGKGQDAGKEETLIVTKPRYSRRLYLSTVLCTTVTSADACIGQGSWVEVTQP